MAGKALVAPEGLASMASEASVMCLSAMSFFRSAFCNDKPSFVAAFWTQVKDVVS